VIRRCLCALAAPLLAQQIPMFDYDVSRPLDVRADFIRQEPGARISELTYASPMGGRVDAYLVEPATPAGRRPSIVFGHWGLGNRTEFLPEAIVYARAGAVSLLINYPWTRPAESRRVFRYEDGQTDVDTARQAVVDLRRAIDILAARQNVDPSRIAYIGHSYGAQWGAILSAVDKRMKTCILMGGVGAQADMWERSKEPEMVELRKGYPAEKRAAYLKVYSQLDGIRYVPHAAPVALYFQFARFDRYFDDQSMNAYFAAASEPKRISWYPAGHDLNDPAAWADRARWLEKHIGLRRVK
jgi:dienelactone hydrolase